MTPLGASLLFIIVSIIISAIKHFIFPSNNPTTSQESSIELKKLYTITDKKAEKQNKSYGSFYQAYHQFHISESEERKHHIEQNFMLQYNSLVIKKSIINDESVIICDQNYLVSIEEGISCNKEYFGIEEMCQWQTTFNVYELPLLKQQTKQTMKLKGQIRSKEKSQQKLNSLKCKKSQQNKYYIGFPLLVKNITIDQTIWTLNKLYIQRNQIWNAQVQEKGSKKSKKLQVKSYDIQKISGKIPKSNNSPIQLNNQYFCLQKNQHIPSVYSLTPSSLCYAIQDEPWLIRCKTKHNQTWQHINILSKNIQQKLFQGFTMSARSPPFKRIQKIHIKFIFLFQSLQQIYQQTCEKKSCTQKKSEIKKSFVTIVYEHVNNPYRVQKFNVQLTFQLDRQSKDSFDNLKSYSFLISEIDPSRIMHTDCSIKLQEKKIKQRYYNKYYWLYEDKVIADVDIYSLLCVFRFDIDENLRVIQIADLIRSQQANHYYDLMFVDWKSLKKIINYKENFQIYLQNNVQQKQKSQSKTLNKSQLNNSNKSSIIDSKNDVKQPENEMDLYFQIIKEQFQAYENFNSPSIQKQNQQKKTIKQSTNSKKITKQKVNTNKKKSNSNKKIKNKKKSKSKKVKNSQTNLKNVATSFTQIQGDHNPSIQTSYNYSFYRNTPNTSIRSEVRKYKFPLPFLLSFTQRMEIINSQSEKPLILFSGVKQFLFTYQLKQLAADVNTSLKKVVDYRYLTLGSTYQHTSKLFSQNEGTPQHQIQTAQSVIDYITQKVNTNPNTKLNIQINDQTHPQIQNTINTIQQSNQQILNQIKSIKTLPVFYQKSTYNQSIAQHIYLQQTHQKYLIVVWGWGIEVYLVDWDKNGFFKQNISQQQISQKLSQKNNSLIEYFLPFIELFATFYCMFQALISSR